MAGITLEENVLLRDHTTFKTGGRARFFVAAKSVEEAKETILFAREKKLPLLVLGGGSNILLLDKDFPGVALKVSWRGIARRERGGDVELSVAAGENWDDLVSLAVEENLFGLENLSGIPGSVGAAPMQNIGAYGREICSVIERVEALDIESGELKAFDRRACEFAYRSSIFKKKPDRYLITSVDLSLQKEGELALQYGDLQKYFNERPYIKRTLSSVRNAVLSIRAQKLPDLRVVGSAGSFFKNPTISSEEYQQLLEIYPSFPVHDAGNGTFKVSAGWLIEHVAKFKGKRLGGAGVYDRHALVLVNYGGARAEQILSLASQIQKKVKEHTNIFLEFEVNIK